MKRITPILAAGLVLAGCDTLNSYGVGGEPVLMCKFRDSTAHIDDKLAGPAQAHASVVRRFHDGDVLCAKPAAPPMPPASAASA